MIADHDYPVTDGARFLKGKKKKKKKAQWRFLPFSQVWFISFFKKIVYNDSSQQFLISRWGKIHEKNFGAQVWVKGTKIGPKTRGFFAIFLFFLESG